MKKNLVLIVLIAFISFSCEKTTPNKTDSIIGVWNWKTTTGGIAGSTYTPESTGEKIIIEFTKDSIYKQYRNDILKYSYPYHTSSDTTQSHSNDRLILFENSSSFDYYTVINFNTLILDDKMPDGSRSEYERIK
jgi:hypothetical protein